MASPRQMLVIKTLVVQHVDRSYCRLFTLRQASLTSFFIGSRDRDYLHDREGKIVRSTSMTNPKFRDSGTSLKGFDIFVANPMRASVLPEQP